MPAPRPTDTIRAARGDDFEAVAALLHEVGRAPVTDAGRADARAVFRHQVLDPDAHHMVVEDGRREVVAFCSLHFRTRLNQATEEAWIADLAFGDGVRGRALGRALLEEAERRALARGCFQLTVESSHQAAEAHELLRGLRMRDMGRSFSKLLAGTVLVAALAALAGCGGAAARRAERPPRQPPSSRSAPRAARPARAFAPLTVPAHPPARSVRVPILTYHRVHEYATELTKSQPDLTVEPATFRAEMDALVRAGFTTITQRQLFDALYRGASLPRRPVIVSVDDGYVDDVTQVLPVLRSHRMVATFYVITRRVHEAGFLDTRQIRRLEAAGMDIGAHTRTHASLPGLPPAMLRSEVEGSAADLRAILGHPVYWFAYPYGAYDASAERAVRDAGFLLAVTTRAGTTASTAAPLAIPRIHVGRAATAGSVVALAGG